MDELLTTYFVFLCCYVFPCQLDSLRSLTILSLPCVPCPPPPPQPVSPSSLSASTLSCSSGSSRGSLTSSRGSLATTSSLGSTSSLSFTDLYLEQPELADPDFQNKLDSLLQESGQGGYRPSSSITTIHEHEVVTGSRGRNTARPEARVGGEAGGAGSPAGGGGCGGGGTAGGAEPSRIQMLRQSETPRSMSSLSPRSSLSSLSPPCSPLISDTNFLSGQTFPPPAEQGVLDLDIHSRLAELELNMNCEEEQLQEEREEKQNHRNLLGEEVKGQKPSNFSSVPVACLKE